MAYAQSSSHFEIQNLRDALAASQKRADKYAHLSAMQCQVCGIELTTIVYSRITFLRVGQPPKQYMSFLQEEVSI